MNAPPQHAPGGAGVTIIIVAPRSSGHPAMPPGHDLGPGPDTAGGLDLQGPSDQTMALEGDGADLGGSAEQDLAPPTHDIAPPKRPMTGIKNLNTKRPATAPRGLK